VPWAKRSTSGFCCGGDQRHAAGAFDLVLPPADEAVVLRGRGLVEPQRILRHGVGGQLAGEAVRAEELVDGFEGDFERAQAEGREAARVHADVHQLVVAQFDRARFQLARQRLRVAGRVRLPVPAGVDADGRAVDRPQHGGALRVAGRLHLDGAEAAGERVFDGLLDEGAKAVDGIRLFERAAQGAQLALGEGHVAGARRGARICQSMAAMRSLMTLMARRTTGVSAKRRRLAGVGLGSSLAGKLDGSEWRAAPASCAPLPRRRAAMAASGQSRAPVRMGPIACRHISRNCSATFTMHLPFLRTKRKGASLARGAPSVFSF
jgi:hypothetical protein